MSSRLPEQLEIDVKSQYSAALAAGPPALVEGSARLLERISPPNWTLEWSLPGWLGDVVGLSAALTANLTLANVYGLAYIKLQDDLIDDEVGEGDRQAALLLSAVLQRKWLLAYTGLFPGGSRFWDFFERYVAQWVAATWRSHQPSPRAFRDFDEVDLRGLGERGSPLKSCAAAACLLTQQEDLLPQLESALDHLLIGAVLLDHALDWADDLAAGRYNAFVAYASALPQTSAYLEANRRRVLEELLVGKAARPYFAVVRRQFQAAINESRAAGVPKLVNYVNWLQSQTNAYAKRLAQGGRAELHALVGQVVGSVSIPGVSVIP